jgi:hypothetical protein
MLPGHVAQKLRLGLIAALLNIPNRSLLTQKLAEGDFFAGEVIKNVEDKIPQGGFEGLIDARRFPDKSGQDGVVLFLFSGSFPGGFGLLQETDGLALHQLTALQGLVGENKTVDIVAISARRMQNKSVRKWVFSGYRDRFQIFQGFFMKDVFPTGMSFIFD